MLIFSSVSYLAMILALNQGFWYFAEKKAKFCEIFGGKFAEKLADFAGFSREESQNLQKTWPISRDFSEKKSNFEGFSGALKKLLEKSVDFMGNFGGKLRQETISKKQPISLDFLGANFAKIDQFCIDMTSVVNVFLTGIIICSFNNSSLEKWAKALWLVPSFSQH